MAVGALPAVRYVAGVLVLVGAYYAAGRASLELQYEGPVAAIWHPVWVPLQGCIWRAALVARAAHRGRGASRPRAASALVITVGNIADILGIALVLGLLLGPRSVLDRLEQVGGMLVAVAAGAAITAAVAVPSVRADGVVEASERPTLWRSWFLADESGALVVIPPALAWAPARSPTWRGCVAWERVLLGGRSSRLARSRCRATCR
jgi:hypothetical protein